MVIFLCVEYEEALDRLLTMLDDNGDGKLSLLELSQHYPNMGEKSLQNLLVFDEDGNGMLDRDELAKFAPDLDSVETMIFTLSRPAKEVHEIFLFITVN